MPTDLILTSVNYTNPALTNGKTYTDGGDYVCNYPLDLTIAFVIEVTQGDKYILASTGDFTELLGCDIQNNNVPTRKWITGDTGQILEIDYIISDTEAMLKQPSSYTANTAFKTIDYWGSPQVAETAICNVDNFGASGVLVNTKIGPVTVNFGTSQSILFGSDPITFDISSTGAGNILRVSYQ